MVKKFKAHINLASPGDHDYLSPVSFEHGQSECLRIQAIRLRTSSREKPYKLPLNLLTWFTEHAPAGREISRDDNNQQNIASLYADLNLLREQIDTFSLKNSFNLEIEINELDQNDESLIRSDQGVMDIEVNLYHGPKTNCSLDLAPILEMHQPLNYPENCGGNGRFDLAITVLKSDQGPLDPDSDKRVLLCDFLLPEKWQNLRLGLIERLRLYEGDVEQPFEYIEDHHLYSELYEAYPLDHEIEFPKGLQVFGPLIPSAPKEKRGPWTVSLNAPFDDPFWQELALLIRANHNRPIKGQLELIIPEPSQNISQKIDISVDMADEDWLIISDGAGLATPIILPVNRPAQPKLSAIRITELTLSTVETAIPSSELLSLQYYSSISKNTVETKKAEGPVNIALTPAKSDATLYTVKPEVTEVTNNNRHLLLLNRISLNKKLKIQKSEFRIKCFWPDQQKTENFKITIKILEKSFSQSVAIDIGSKSISAAGQVAGANEGEKQISNLALGQFAETAFLSPEFIPSSVTLSGKTEAKQQNNKQAEQQQAGIHRADKHNWHAKNYPLNISYAKLPWQQDAIEQRLKRQHRHYDIALPASKETTDTTLVNLKRLFSQNNLIEQLPKNKLAIARIKRQQQDEPATIGYAASINPGWLMADCLDEFYNFFGTYLTGTRNSLENQQQSKTGKQLMGADVTLTHNGQLSNLGLRRYKNAGATALKSYEQGSFSSLGAVAELLGLSSQDQLRNNVHLINETIAAAYHSLKFTAEHEQPARCKKVQHIHMDIGASHAGLVASTAWLGETNALIETVHSTIDLPLGGRALELALAKEITSVIETAISAGAAIIRETELPLNGDEIRAAETPATETEFSHLNFLQSLRNALVNITHTKDPAGNDLHICIGASKNGSSGPEETEEKTDRQQSTSQSPHERQWPFSIASSVKLNGEPVSLWHGLRGEQLVCLSDEQGENWRIELRLEAKTLAQRVGPLTTYLAFLAEFLPRAIDQSLSEPEGDNLPERLFSISGGTSLFPPLRALIQSTAKKLGYRFLTPPNTYQQAKAATSLGALALHHHQVKQPYLQTNPNLILVPISDQSADERDMMEVASKGKLQVIQKSEAEGTLPETCTSLQLIETIPGIGALLQQDPKALYCQTYLDDLDRATKEQWAEAGAEWQSWLDQCYQTMLNMPVNISVNAATEEGVDVDGDQVTPAVSLPWAYKTLKKGEALIKIGDHEYWVSSGLTSSFS